MLPNDEMLKSKRQPAADRPYPRECPKCGQTSVMPNRMDYQDTVRFDGHSVTYLARDIEIPICGNCGEKVFSEQVDAQLCEALQRHLHLLTPAEIRDGIGKLGLSDKEVADRLGIAEDLLWRWTHGFAVPSRAMDNLLRVFLQVPEARTVLSVPAIESTMNIGSTPNALS
jgi:putative zinc finger/helix-turn-helix YgiT family protein